MPSKPRRIIELESVIAFAIDLIEGGHYVEAAFELDRALYVEATPPMSQRGIPKDDDIPF